MAFSSCELFSRALGSQSAGQEAKFPADFPFHKRIPGTRFVVDGFGQCAGRWSTAYFLTHFHSDHYSGLTSTWDSGIIFCSQVTRRLVVECLHINPALVVELDIGMIYRIDECMITFVDANHCPGAVQILFELPEQGTRYVHTGDMRYSPRMKEDASLCNFIGSDAVFLDTTYCDPKFRLHKQENCTQYIVETIHSVMSDEDKQSTLFIISTYLVGKEKILLAIAQKSKCLIYVDDRKLAVLKCLDLGEDAMRYFTTNESEANVHVVSWNWLGETWPYFRPNFGNMEQLQMEKRVERVVGFVPTGWTHETSFPVRKKGSLEIHLVPYSEHSSYDELREYIGFLRPREVYPTVGLDDKGVAADNMKKHFRNLVDETASKRRFLRGFDRKAAGLQQLSVFGRNAKRKGREEFKEGEGVDSSTKDQLQSILPDSVADEEIDDLLKKACGDLNAAVSLFFQQQQSSSQDKEQSSSQDKSMDSAGLNRGSGVKLSSVSPKTPTLNRKPTKLVSSGGSKKKAKQTPTKGQTTILSFFKKGLSTNTNDIDTTAENKPSLLIPLVSLETPGNENTDMLSSGDGHTQTGEGESKVNQLLTILDGQISHEAAEALLDKGGGDIGKALDLHYDIRCDPSDTASNQDEHQAFKSTSVNRSDPGDQDEPQAVSNQEEPQSSRNSGVTVLNTGLTQSKDSLIATNVGLSLSSYDPVAHACWRADEPAPYLHLARTFDSVEKESGRHRTAEMLCNMFRSLIALSPGDVLPALYLITNRIAPDYENVDLNVGASTVVAAIEEATGTPKAKLKDMYNTMGDLGDVAQACRQTQSMLLHPRPLSISHVFNTLKQISKVTGTGSGNCKKGMVLSLLRSCREKEVTYIVRTLVQNMRIGAMIRTVLPALAQAVLIHKETLSTTLNMERLKPKLQEASTAIVEAFNLLPNFDCLVPHVLEKGVGELSTRIVLTPGFPMKPMLAKITSGLSEVLKQFEGKSFTCEFKYDGFRAQIHLLDDGSIRIFSRNCENATSRFPDVVESVKSTMRPGIRSFILDAELVAVDRKNSNKLLVFQSLSTRERGRTGISINMENITVDVCVFVFDAMYVDGEPLVKVPFRLRRERMHDIFPVERPGYVVFAEEMTLDPKDHKEESIQKFLEEAVSASCEGLMAKALDEGSWYAPAKRAESWLKVKRDYVEGLSDSLDLVPIGAWYGNGRKAGWFSPFLLACYDPDKEEYQSVCRVMSGFTDSFYQRMKEFYSEGKLLNKKPSYYRTLEQPDVWLAAARVWEIRGADYTVSPVHQAAVGVVHPERGISMRFPRFIQERSDKSPEDASSPLEIANYFNAQTRKLDMK